MSYKTRWFRILSGAIILTLLLANLPLAIFAPQQAFAQNEPVFINEIHYDNASTDAGEAIEIAGPAGTDLTGWSLVLYNGSGGVTYTTTALSGVISDQQNGFGVLHFTYPVNGIQNGAPDGLALVDDGGAVVQFLSYEGSFTATNGPAVGMVSEDIGVIEGGSDPAGLSLQLSGTGTLYSDFSWTAPSASSFGAVNSGQVFEVPVIDLVINEFSASTTGTDVEYLELYGMPNTDYSAFSVLEIEGDTTGAGVVDEVIAVGTTDASGFWLASLAANALENGTLSLLLVEGFTGALGNDLDTNNDGIFDSTPWTSVRDSVAVNDGGAGDFTYGTNTLGVAYDGFAFAPGGASRIPDGFDSDAISNWVRNDFDLAGIPGYAGSIVLGEAYNTPGAPNLIFVPPPEACGDPFTPIYTVQGNADASPLVGTEVAVEGVVVGDFQNNASLDNGNLNGFHVQDSSGDGDSTTSDGVFIYAPGGEDVAVGEHVRVRGAVSEFNGMTEITASQIWHCGSGTVAPTALALPVGSVGDFEAYEGMLVSFPQPLVISEYFNFDRYGEIVLTSQRHLTPTAQFEPGSAEAAFAAQQFLLDRITLDDGRSAQNPDPAIHPNGSVFDLNNLFRGGDLVANVTGVLDYSFNLYRIQPTQGADYIPANPRPTQPDEVGGFTKVASFNVLNYFTTIDRGPAFWICGPNQDQECRGADTYDELARQRAKIVAALSTINADVVGLIEIENNPGDGPTADLVSGLNDFFGIGTYDYIATGAIGTDAIRTALIYKPGEVTPLGSYAILDTSVDPRFLDDKNRPVLAQTFVDNLTGEIFTVAVNHLKSKGSDCNDVGDPDLGDGAGNCNVTRTLAAQALVDWLATDPTTSGDTDFLIIGDLNSYDKEDPIDILLAAGYTDLVAQFLGEEAYSYVFDGQTGYLDHALASAGMTGHISGASIWHINADEPDLIDYEMTFKQDAQDAIFAPDAYRSSDHDPVVIGICEATPPELLIELNQTMLWPPRHQYVTIQAALTASDNSGVAPTITLISVTSNEADEGLGDGDMPNDIVIIDDQTFQLRAERSGTGIDRIYTITYLVTDSCGNSQYVSAEVTVPHNR